MRPPADGAGTPVRTDSHEQDGNASPTDSHEQDDVVRTDGGVSPDYEVSQYFPQSDVDSVDRREDYESLRGEYGHVRAYAKANPDHFRDLQRSLNQAGMGTTADIYLVRCVHNAGLGAVVGLFVGALLATALVVGGTFAGMASPVPVEGWVGDVLRANKELLAGVLLAAAIGLVAGIVGFLGTYRYPDFLAGHRRRAIEFLLPHAIVYMYALSHGGMNLVEVVDRMADSEDAYGEVAREFNAVRRDMDLFGNDLISALQNRRNVTPSASMERFLDDFVSVLDTGGDVTGFLEDAADTYLEEAEEEQEDFLNTISLYSEVYVSLFVAAPLFLVVIMMVISFLGGSTLAPMYVLIYIGLPAGMALFLGVLVALSAAYTYPATRLVVDDPHDFDGTTATARDDERIEQYELDNGRAVLAGVLERSATRMRRDPRWSLAATVPLALVFLAAVVLTGGVSPDTFVADPVQTTSLLGVAPFLIVAVPLALFYERKRARENAIQERFPAALNTLSSANKMGIPFPDALGLLARYTSGRLATEVRYTRNDLRWSGDVTRSLLRMANRIDVPQLSRTMKLVADGLYSSGDLARVLQIAAQDARERQRIIRRRRQEMSTYLAVVVIGFVVYLMVIVFLDVGYMQPIEDIATERAASSENSPVALTAVPTETYRMLLFHSVLIQAVGTGIIAGKLADNNVLSGLKYAIVLVVLSLVVFMVIH